jgi:hypothetical protein
MFYAVPWLSYGLSQRRPGFEPRPIHVGFVIDTVALRQVFLRALLFTPYPCHSANAPYSLIYHICYISLTTEKFVKQYINKYLNIIAIYLVYWSLCWIVGFTVQLYRKFVKNQIQNITNYLKVPFQSSRKIDLNDIKNNCRRMRKTTNKNVRNAILPMFGTCDIGRWWIKATEEIIIKNKWSMDYRI